MSNVTRAVKNIAYSTREFNSNSPPPPDEMIKHWITGLKVSSTEYKDAIYLPKRENWSDTQLKKSFLLT